MCESKGQGARSGCVISGLGSASASMVLRECGQPDGGERGGSGQARVSQPLARPRPCLVA